MVNQTTVFRVQCSQFNVCKLHVLCSHRQLGAMIRHRRNLRAAPQTNMVNVKIGHAEIIGIIIEYVSESSVMCLSKYWTLLKKKTSHYVRYM